MRKITKIILHCSASDSSKQTASMIDAWHRERGFDRIGYHYFVRTDGLIEGGRPVEDVGAHCYGHNRDSVGICLAGLTRFSERQFQSLEAILECLREVFPEAKIYGHNQFDKKKECPVYNVSRFKTYYENKENNKWKCLKTFLRSWKQS